MLDKFLFLQDALHGTRGFVLPAADAGADDDFDRLLGVELVVGVDDFLHRRQMPRHAQPERPTVVVEAHEEAPQLVADLICTEAESAGLRTNGI